MSRRPDLYTSYKTETSIFPTLFQKFWFALLVIFSFAIPFILSNYWILLITTSLLIAIASWGLNIVSGYAGQVNLGHGVFVGIGTYVSSVLGGVATTSVIGYELDMVIWLPLSGLAATLIGIILSPVSARLKGLNLGLVTLALVFIGSHFFSNLKFITGGAGLGRKAAKLTFLGVDLESGLTFGNLIIEKNDVIYFFLCLWLQPRRLIARKTYILQEHSDGYLNVYKTDGSRARQSGVGSPIMNDLFLTSVSVSQSS